MPEEKTVYLKTKGLVIRETRIKEADKLLTLLCPGQGKMTVKARGVMKDKSKNSASCQLFCWSDFTLYENRGYYTVTEATPVDMFSELQTDPVKFSLGAYFCEICELLSQTDWVSDELLRLTLNMLYALCRLDVPSELVRGAFEARALVCGGYMPDIEVCAGCGCEPDTPIISISEFTVRCVNCPGEYGEEKAISVEAYRALKYFLSAPLKKLLGISLSPGDIGYLVSVTEAWLESRVGGKASRNYYKGMLNYG
ncbi:MAG: DNA repair protein RecO [Ruminococcaceae bacterium]|nr:DNA repair protein RecO [Oscillospiraceae bacterium]